ncbi:MAG: FAD-dependent oxidoreductase [Lentisphaeria bacterium]|nr:FAD-dependent oxidoreductase [Lentisphaeria bacterium]
MIEYIQRDVAVIGAGAAGLFAAKETMQGGCSTIVIDRESRAGGILNQCIHNGFGLHCFKKELTGPEFAAEAEALAVAANAEFRFRTTVRAINRNTDGTFNLELLSREHGVTLLTVKAVIMAVGCRERSRGNLAIPGRRPAGVWTAGTAQKLLNI